MRTPRSMHKFYLFFLKEKKERRRGRKRKKKREREQEYCFILKMGINNG